MAPIDAYQEDITAWKEDGMTNSDILGRLHDDGVQISDRTLKRRLQTWGVRSSRITTHPVTNKLID